MLQERISTAIRGSVGLLELDRPRALNALTTAMVEDLARELTALTRAPAIRTIVLRSTESRAFCAGGDMRRIHDFCLAGEHAAAESPPTAPRPSASPRTGPACSTFSSAGAVSSRAILRHPDFVEGVRAVLVDRTRDPAWVARQARTPP